MAALGGCIADQFSARLPGYGWKNAVLHRFLFVAGMTVGVMTPLIWAAYTARPASHPVHAPTARTVTAIPDAPKLARAKTRGEKTRNDVASVTPLEAGPPPHVAARAKPPRPVVTIASVAPPPRKPDRFIPAVVDSYNGAHIITICAALTVNEQLRAGCP